MRWRVRNGSKGRAGLATLLALAALTAGCSSSSSIFSSSPPAQPGSQQSFSDRFTQLFSSGGSSQASAAAMPESEEPSYCPVIEVRQGASTLSITSASADPSAMQLRYQGTIGQTARECAYVGGNLSIKVGVQGRVILGPEGGPGEMEIPLRYALVREGPTPKTVWTKLYRFPVAIGEGQPSVPFTHVQEDLVVPKPRPSDLEAYVIYIGFDAIAMKPQAKPQRPQKPAKRP